MKICVVVALIAAVGIVGLAVPADAAPVGVFCFSLTDFTDNFQIAVEQFGGQFLAVGFWRSSSYSFPIVGAIAPDSVDGGFDMSLQGADILDAGIIFLVHAKIDATGNGTISDGPATPLAFISCPIPSVAASGDSRPSFKTRTK